MKYIVQIKSLTPTIGAKERTATFTDYQDALKQWHTWKTWLDADVDLDHCDLYATWYAESKDSGYCVMMSELPSLANQPGATIEDIDFDSHN